MTMRMIVLAGTASLLVAGAAWAATGKLKTMQVDLHNGSVAGSVAQDENAGDVARKVIVIPAPQFVPSLDPFVELDRMTAQMQQQHVLMMQQMAALERQAASGAVQPGQVVVTTNMPVGSSYQYTVVSTSNGKGGSCTQTIEWKSDGSAKEPQVTRASSGDCDAVKPNNTPVPASVPQAQPGKPFDPRTI